MSRVDARPKAEEMDWIPLATFVVELIGLLLLVESRIRSAARAGRKSQRLVLPDSPYFDKRRGRDTDSYGNKAWHIRWLFRAGSIGLVLVTISLTAFFTEGLLTYPWDNPFTGQEQIPLSWTFALGCIITEIVGVALIRYSAHMLTSKKRIHILADIAVLSGYVQEQDDNDSDEDSGEKKERLRPESLLKPIPKAIHRAGRRTR